MNGFVVHLPVDFKVVVEVGFVYDVITSNVK